MLSQYKIRNIIGIIGNVVSFGLFISPAPTFWKIFKRKDVEQFSPNPYLATIVNCAMWVFYGMPFVHPHSTLVVTINGFGLGLSLLGYIGTYLLYSNKKQRTYVLCALLAEVCLLGLADALILHFTHQHTRPQRDLVAGIICTVFNICMYAMPLDVMRLVITTKSVEYLPFWLSLANFVNSCIWLTYAQLYRFDLYLTIANASGAALGAAQLILYLTYYKSTPNREHNNPTHSQLELV